MYTRIQLDRKAAKTPDALVVLMFSDKKPAGPAADIPELKRALSRPETRGDLGVTTLVDPDAGPRLVLLGLGEKAKLDGNGLRTAADGLVKRLDAMQAQRVTLAVADSAAGEIDPVLLGQALGEGLGLASFTFNDFKGSQARQEQDKQGDKPRPLRVHVDAREAGKAFERGIRLAESANYARRIAATPPNIATTTWIADQAKKLASGNPRLKCKVYKGADLAKLKLVGIENVGKASENPPCLIELVYEPRRRAKQTVLLVGKTIVYDTGGLSLKTNNGMVGMKYDKSGGVSALGAMHAVANLVQPNCRVVALLPTAENSVSDEAMRPDDILTYRNGVTVEVTNTDAEGRLVLADALAYGCEKHEPAAVIDLATLTGGIVVALGSTYAGYWCDNDDLRQRLETASASSGEQIWRMPMSEAYRKMMKSDHADIVNSPRTREAAPCQGAAFLTYFVPEGTPWAHIDIAGAATIAKAAPPFAAGPTGFGVRLLADMLANWS